MSDYVHNKVIRLPFPSEVINKAGANDVHDCERYLKDLLGDLWDKGNNSFEIGFSESAYYIDWVYYSTYGENSNDFGNVRMLTKKELKEIKPYFNKLEINYKDEDLRHVDYCYYNCCEPPDYYTLENKDESEVFTSLTQQLQQIRNELYEANEARDYILVKAAINKLDTFMYNNQEKLK